MDLRQLNTFIVVAEQGSLSKAAARLHIAQPALSRQIHLLENDLGQTLFIRHGRGMVLTEAGQKLGEHAIKILQQIEDARQSVQEASGNIRGKIAVGLPPTVGAILASKLVERCATLYPQIIIRVVQGFSGTLLEWVQNRELDIAVVYSGRKSAGLTQTPLLTEQLYFVPPTTAKTIRRKTLPFADIAAVPLILPGPQQGLRQLIEATAASHHIRLQVSVEADDLPLTKELVMKGLYGTILPWAAMQQEVSSGRLHPIAFREPPLKRRLVMTRLRDRQISQVIRLFGELMREEVHDMVRSGQWHGAEFSK